MKLPNRPARADDNPNAPSFARATSMPAAAAARSLALTASHRSPVRLRRRLATIAPASTSTTSTVSPNAGRKLSAPFAEIPTSSPNRCGRGALRPPTPPDSAELPSTSCSMATAEAMVATARLIPRTLSAGAPTASPTPVATPTATSTASGKGRPLSATSMVTNPATPAKAIWAREI